MDQKPSVGRVVHYMSYGTPGGEFKPEHRSAIITAVPTENTVSLAVINPTGIFFHLTCKYSDGLEGGTWHWPEKV